MSEQADRRGNTQDSPGWHEVGRVRLLSESLTPQLQRIVVRCAIKCGMPGAALVLTAGARLGLRAGYRISNIAPDPERSVFALKPPEQGVRLIRDTAQDQEAAKRSEVTGEPHIRSIATTAVRSPGGHEVAHLSAFSNKPMDDEQEFRPELLQAFRDVLESLLKNRDAERIDRDTGMLSASGFVDSLSATLRGHVPEGRPLSLLIFSIPGLSVINRKQGAAAGDRAIATLAELINRRVLVEHCQFGRISGSSFAVLIERSVSPEFRQGIVRGVRNGMYLDSDRIRVAASAVLLDDSCRAYTAESLLLSAERATARREVALQDQLPVLRLEQLRDLEEVQARTEKSA